MSSVLEAVARLSAEGDGTGLSLARVAEILCANGYRSATYVKPDGRVSYLVGRSRPDPELVRMVAAKGQPVVSHPHRSSPTYRAGLPVAAESMDAGVLILVGTPATRSADEESLLNGVASLLAADARARQRVAQAEDGQRRAESLVAFSTDVGTHLDLSRVLSRLVERSMDLFDADRGGIFTRQPNGSMVPSATRNLSAEFCQFIEHATSLPLGSRAFEEQRIVSVPDFPDDPLAIELRPALIREGINTVTIAPLMSDGVALGVLALYHDSRYEWSAEDLSLLEKLARQGARVTRNAQHFSQMATWAAQLQSIQQLGARLTRLRTVSEIGQAICAELNQLIDFHNVRVYRLEGDDCVPVAWRGEIGEYEGEDMEQLQVKVGEGVTGWVARYGLAQNVGDAAKDRRAQTIPGTDADLDESLLLAPMLFEDEVIGVIVLAKLGLNKFSPDDLRLLEIYASIAAQAMSNADTTERLRAQSDALARQLNSQRELLRVTESILGTLDTQALLEEIAARLKSLVQVDNICVDIHDQRAGMLRPIFARGVHALEYLAATIPDDQGVGGYVVRTGDAQLVQDELADPRVSHFANLEPQAGALIVAPLRSADRIQGLLTIERLGVEARFSEEEFELVKLFAAHVSIALRNAETHRAVELRAETDTLTGLWNHGSLIEHIERLVEQGDRFAMLMVDLDEFKVYNDAFGHQAGNVMLRRVATLIRSSCRDSDEVFRYGGDEFAILLPNTGQAGARTVAEKIYASVTSVNDGRPMPAPLSCSTGIAVFPRDGRDGSEIILAADRACYAAKRAGRARIATAMEGRALAGEFQPTEPSIESSEASYFAA